MTANDLAREGKEGRTAVLTALKELRATGYVRTLRHQLPNGHWHTDTFVFDTAQRTEVGFPHFGSPEVGLSDCRSSINNEKNHSPPNPPGTKKGFGGDITDDEIRDACKYVARLRGKSTEWGRGWARNALVRARSAAGLDEDDVAAVVAWRRWLVEQASIKQQDDEDAARTRATSTGLRTALNASGQSWLLQIASKQITKR